ncbi:MAG: M23 family metallopeptidase [candidate division KSB1 bacterium]|nr:M23 family metallopeptidase [candidate division KSB1 bacterium]
MPKAQRLLLLFLFPLVLSAEEYFWPTEASRLLTSSFAESRNGRFHAGIDIKTWGQTGFPVFAVRDGYVSRISVSPFGYGRALYLTLDTGETVLYAHLERFADPIQDYVKREQAAQESYEIQLFLTKDKFSVKQGEIVAYTGDSGVGYPHLHFELRDEHGNPVNPFRRGYFVEDNVRPVITKVLIQPLDAFSSVDHDYEPVILYPVAKGGGQYEINRPVAVHGRIGFGVSAFDQMEGADHRFGIYGSELWIDDQLIFASRCDGYPIAFNNHFNLDRDFRQRVRGTGTFYNLYRDLGNRLPFYPVDAPYYGVVDFTDGEKEQEGIVEIPKGVVRLKGTSHRFVIRTFDYWGNAAEVAGRLWVDGGESVVVPPHDDEEEMEELQSVPEQESIHLYDVAFRFYDRYIRLVFTAQRPGLGEPIVRGEICKRKIFTLPVRKAGSVTYIGAWPLSDCQTGPLVLSISAASQPQNEQRETLNFMTVPVGKERLLQSDDGLCSLFFEKTSLFKDLFVRSYVEKNISAYQVVGHAYRFEPSDVPLNSGVRVILRYPESEPAPRQLGVYQKSGNSLLFLDNVLNGQACTVSARAKSLGVFVLARDSQPPQIAYLLPADKSSIKTRRPMLKASFRDNLSGIGGENSRVLKLDGRKVIAEYDYEREVLFYVPEEPLAPGNHTVELFVRDKSGNAASLKHTFTIE